MWLWRASADTASQGVDYLGKILRDVRAFLSTEVLQRMHYPLITPGLLVGTLHAFLFRDGAYRKVSRGCPESLLHL